MHAQQVAKNNIHEFYYIVYRAGVRMIKSINNINTHPNFLAKDKGKKKNDKTETVILPNNVATRVKQGFLKTAGAFIDYPVKGLQGDINSNFYEFLTMGIVPYLIGSATLMFGFNAVNDVLSETAKKAGKKLALGVVLWGVFKELSKALVTKPVYLATGVDTELPYQNKVYPMPKKAGEEAELAPFYQQRTVFDSKEFYRTDLLEDEFFENVADRLGHKDLNDPISEMSPVVQNIVATNGLAKSLSTYLWAGVGVALASQDDWLSFFDSISNRKAYNPAKGESFFSTLSNKAKVFTENSLDISKNFFKSFGRSCKSLWKGTTGTPYMKHAGKAFVTTATLLTAFLTTNSIIKAKQMANRTNTRTIDNNKESMVI